MIVLGFPQLRCFEEPPLKYLNICVVMPTTQLKYATKNKYIFWGYPHPQFKYGQFLVGKPTRSPQVERPTGANKVTVYSNHDNTHHY